MGSLALVVAATIVAFAGGMAMFALSRAGRRHRRIARKAAQHNVLPAASLGAPMSALLTRARHLAGELDVTVDAHRSRARLAGGLASHSKRPLWQQLDDSNQAYELERVRTSLADFARELEALDAPSRGIFDQLEVDLDPVLELATQDWTTAEILSQGGRLDDFVAVCAAASERLHAFARDLARWQPISGYR